MKLAIFLIINIILSSFTLNPPQILSDYMEEQTSKGSQIRIMSELAKKLAKEYGADKIHNFSMGSPTIPPPPEYFEALKETAEDNYPLAHDYVSVVGLDESRTKYAELISELQGVQVTKDQVVETSGCAGAINIFLKAVLEVDDEVIIVAPYFAEYTADIENWKAKPVILKTKIEENFEINIQELEKKITKKTRVLMINTPNNPTGNVYSQELIHNIAELLRKKSEENGRIIYILSDDVYARILYGNEKHAQVFKEYEYSVVTYSLSKDLSIPGERMGCAVANPLMPNYQKLVAAMGFNNDAMGICNANRFHMRVISKVLPKKSDTGIYEESAKIICDVLEEEGLEFVRPKGAFYVFPKVPFGLEEMEFCKILAENFVITVPGSAFGLEGFFRMAFGKPPEEVKKAIPFLKKGIEAARLMAKK